MSVAPPAALLALLLIAGSSCASAPKRTVQAEPAPLETRPSVVFRFLPSPSAALTDEPSTRHFVAPVARTELGLPDYPRVALAAGASPFTVVLRITIAGEDGRVVAVEQSPLAPSSAGPFETDFRLAAERAVRLWRFWPGRIERTEETTADGTPLVEMTPVPVIYDVSFRFEIVSGQPKVTTSAGDRVSAESPASGRGGSPRLR